MASGETDRGQAGETEDGEDRERGHGGERRETGHRSRHSRAYRDWEQGAREATEVERHRRLGIETGGEGGAKETGKPGERGPI